MVRLNPPMPAPLAEISPVLLWGGAAVLVALQTWRGWRKGVARQAAELVAIIGAYLGGYVAGPYLAPMLGMLGFPAPVLRVVGGAIVGLLVYGAVTLSAAVLFKKTAQQEFGPVRWVFGLGGAALGIFTGLLAVWVAVVVIRVSGTLVEPKVAHSAAAPQRGPAIPPWAETVVKLKHTLENGNTGPMVRKVDPVPAKTYSVMEKMGSVLATQRSMERFLKFPGVRPLAENPKIVALREDVELLRAAQSSNYLALLRNPRLVAAANDPEIVRLAQRLDFEKALDYALAPAQNGR